MVAMHFECGDLLDTLESGHEEVRAAVSAGPWRLGRLCCWATPPDMRAELSQLINDLGEPGNDAQPAGGLAGDAPLPSGESTGSESSIEEGPDAQHCHRRDPSGPADCASPDEPHSG